MGGDIDVDWAPDLRHRISNHVLTSRRLTS